MVTYLSFSQSREATETPYCVAISCFLLSSSPAPNAVFFVGLTMLQFAVVPEIEFCPVYLYIDRILGWRTPFPRDFIVIEIGHLERIILVDRETTDDIFGVKGSPCGAISCETGAITPMEHDMLRLDTDILRFSIRNRKDFQSPCAINRLCHRRCSIDTIFSPVLGLRWVSVWEYWWEQGWQSV